MNGISAEAAARATEVAPNDSDARMAANDAEQASMNENEQPSGNNEAGEHPSSAEMAEMAEEMAAAMADEEPTHDANDATADDAEIAHMPTESEEEEHAQHEELGGRSRKRIDLRCQQLCQCGLATSTEHGSHCEAGYSGRASNLIGHARFIGARRHR